MAKSGYAWIGVGVASIAASAGAQCVADWQPDIGQPGVDTLSLRKGLAIADLGDGPEVLISGRFAGVGGIAANGNARWSPADGWRTFGESGLTSASGSLLGSNVATTYQGDFVAGGGFAFADGEPVSNIARFEVSPEGDFWDPLNGGVNGQVLGMRVLEFEGEQLLFVGGVFTAAGGGSVFSPGVAAWDGDAWRGFGDGVSGAVNDFMIYDDGTGAALYIAGRFSVPGARNGHIARWNGSEFEDVGGGLSGGDNPRATVLAVHDFGDGDELVVGGNFLQAGGNDASCIARWNGDTFAPVGDGFDNTVTALTTADVGDGQKLYATGSFILSGAQPVNGFASWMGAAWQTVGDGVSGGSVPGIAAMAEYDLPGVGNSLVVAGGFSFAGFEDARNIAIWACGAGCRVDLDGDGQLTLFDFLVFQNLFDVGDIAADFDGDGVLTLFDFLTFQNEFDAGCE
ncbi:MAG: GC-type dockerin domain-anchored protein [Phycisphaerales bacterium JB060]